MTKANGDFQAVILVGPGDRLYPLVDEASSSSSSNNNNIVNTSNSMANCIGISSTNSSTPSLATIPSQPPAQPSPATQLLQTAPATLTVPSINSASTSPTVLGGSSTSINYSKAMLPICNRPLIYHPLTWLIQSGIGEVLIVVHQKLHSKIAGYVNKQYEHADGTKIEVVPVAENEGSLAALLAVRHRLKNDFMVLSCDLITDAPLSIMTDLHRSKGALMTCLFSGPQASGLLNSSGSNAPDSSSLTDPRYLASLAGEEILVALDMSSMTTLSDATNSVSSCDLIYCAPQADSLDETNSFLPIKMSTLFRYPKMRLRTDLLDPHCYLFSPAIFDVIEEIINTTSKSGNTNTNDITPNLVVPASLFSLREDLIPKVLRRMHRFHNSSNVPASTFAVIIDSGNFCLRANTLPALLEATRQLIKFSGSTFAKIASSAEISQRSQVGNDSLFGEGSRLGERSSIKKSVVGNYCSIGSAVKVVNCIVMDGAIIEDGCKLEGCIIGPNALIREKCQLKDCDVAGAFELAKEHTAKAETFGNNRELVEDLY